MKTLLRSLLTLVGAAAVMSLRSVAQTSDISVTPSPSPAITLSPSGMTSPGMSLSPGTTSTSSSTSATATGQPDEAEMMKQMVELSKLNENHKILTDLDGTWSYTITMWMAPNAPPTKSSGTAIRKSVMGGRYVQMDATGQMKMPGPDGKLKDFTFIGHGMEGYDNVKKKFVGTWMDNMGTGIMMSEGDYDPSAKTFTYTSEMEPVPGMKTKVREVVKLADKNHMNFEWYEDRGGQEIKTMEINYTRKK